jgi:hypothetical protein
LGSYGLAGSNGTCSVEKNAEQVPQLPEILHSKHLIIDVTVLTGSNGICSVEKNAEQVPQLPEILHSKHLIIDVTVLTGSNGICSVEKNAEQDPQLPDKGKQANPPKQAKKYPNQRQIHKKSVYCLANQQATVCYPK